MSKPFLIPFQADHLLEIAARFNTTGLGDVWKLGKVYAESPAFSGVQDGKIIGAAGVMILWRGLGEAWAWLSQDAVKDPRWFHRVIKENLEEIQTGMRLWRVQCTCEESDERARKWALRLGFQSEGLLECYGPDGKNHVRYARIRSEFCHAKAKTVDPSHSPIAA